MKKMMVIPFMLVGLLLTGCSVEFDTDSSRAEKFESKIEEFTNKAEALGNEFETALDELKKWRKKENLLLKIKNKWLR